MIGILELNLKLNSADFVSPFNSSSAQWAHSLPASDSGAKIIDLLVIIFLPVHVCECVSMVCWGGWRISWIKIYQNIVHSCDVEPQKTYTPELETWICGHVSLLSPSHHLTTHHPPKPKSSSTRLSSAQGGAGPRTKGRLGGKGWYIYIYNKYMYIYIYMLPPLQRSTLFVFCCYFCFCRKHWKINGKRSSGHGTEEKRTGVSASTRVKQSCGERYVRGLTWRGLIWYARVRVPPWK